MLRSNNHRSCGRLGQNIPANNARTQTAAAVCRPMVCKPSILHPADWPAVVFRQTCRNGTMSASSHTRPPCGGTRGG
ncbi:MAG TPA: hypothetical protein PK052_08045, partial [Anaerohalosphaeraceae bacterium]|nr:hypothetical protein [Anaerohalosphaeraceae bacterium]